MSESLSMPATIWKFQIVQMSLTTTDNNSVIPDSSCVVKNTGNAINNARIANRGILDHIVDANKMVVRVMGAGV